MVLKYEVSEMTTALLARPSDHYLLVTIGFVCLLAWIAYLEDGSILERVADCLSILD
jgi:hypothetical protein